MACSRYFPDTETPRALPQPHFHTSWNTFYFPPSPVSAMISVQSHKPLARFPRF